MEIKKQRAQKYEKENIAALPSNLQLLSNLNEGSKKIGVLK